MQKMKAANGVAIVQKVIQTQSGKKDLAKKVFPLWKVIGSEPNSLLFSYSIEHAPWLDKISKIWKLSLG